MSVFVRIPKETGQRAASVRATNTRPTLRDAATIQLAQDGRVNFLAPLLHATVVLCPEVLVLLSVLLCDQSEYTSAWGTRILTCLSYSETVCQVCAPCLR